MKSIEEQINDEITLAVERIVRASKSAAIAALERGFMHFGHQQLESHPNESLTATPKKRRTSKKPSPSRSSEEIVELSTRFLAVVRGDPGQSMSALAPKLGLKPGELKVPVARLRAAKKIKTTGERKKTCYFPVSQNDAA